MNLESSHSKKINFVPLEINLFSLHQIFEKVLLQRYRLTFTMSEDSDNNTINIRLGKVIPETGNYHYIEKYIPINYMNEPKRMVRLINSMGKSLVKQYGNS